MALIAGTIKHPDLVSERNAVEEALFSMVGTEKAKSTIVDMPGLSMGLVTMSHEQGTEKKRIARIGQSVLMWTGYIVEMADARNRLERSGDAFDGAMTDAEVLLESYLRIGIESLQGLNGLYGIVIWDDREKSFIAVTDRCGFTRIYYWLGREGLVFGSNCRAILSHSGYCKGIDKEGIINFLGAGYCFEDRTLFQDIKLIPQGCRLEYKDGRIELKKYWDYSVKPVEGGLEEYTERFFSILNESFDRCVNGLSKVFIPLSGGLDSRTIAGLAILRGLEIHSCTCGHPRFRDFRYGNKLAKKVSTHHTALALGNDYLKKYGALGVERTEGQVVMSIFYLSRLYEWVGSANVLVSGFLGDTLSGMNLTDGTANTEEAIRSKFLRSFDDEALTTILTPPLQSLCGINSAYLKKSLSNAQAESMCDKTMIVNLRERQRRLTSHLMSGLGSKWTVVAPFADNHVVDFIFTVPIPFRDKQRMYKNMIGEKLSAVASVREAGSGSRLKSTWWSWRWESLKGRMPSVIQQNSLRLRKRIENSRLTQMFGERDSFSVIDINEAMRTGSAGYFQDLFLDTELMVDIFNINTVRELFRAHMERHVNNNSMLCRIATIIQWRKQFEI